MTDLGMKDVTIKEAIAYFQSGQGEWSGKSEFGRQCVNMFLAYYTTSPLNKDVSLSDEEEVMLVGILEQIYAPSPTFSLEELFRLAWFLEYLKQNNRITPSIDGILSQLDDLARKFTINVNYNFDYFMSISPYLILRYENDTTSDGVKNKLRHTMLLQIGMLDAFTSSGRIEDITPYVEALTKRYCPDNILIKCLWVLCDYQRLYIFPAKTKRLMNQLFAVIFEAYGDISPENREIIDHAIKKLVKLPFWTDKEILEKLTVDNAVKSGGVYPAFRMADSLLYMATSECYYFPVLKL